MPVCYSENSENLENSLGYSFKNKQLLIDALTHRSFYHENPDKVSLHNERLEFLGDSVLGLVIVEHLFNYDSGFTESLMSKIKSYLVRGSLLADIANEISLGRYIRLGRGEDETGGRRKKSILANALEAIFGAIYMDAGYAAAKGIILRLLKEKIKSAISSREYFDYKTGLQEKSQTIYGILPEYRVVAQEGDEHRKTFTVEVFIKGEKFGSGRGKNKKEAQTNAAKEAMEKFEKDL